MPDVNATAIHEILYCLGITANYTGFFQTACAVELAVQQPERLLLVTKWLYPEVASRYQTTWYAVERNIRTTADLAWRYNRLRLEQMARCDLPRRPNTARFLAILAAGAAQKSADRPPSVAEEI